MSEKPEAGGAVKPVKILTLWEPWASATVLLAGDGSRIKQTETRTRATRYRGELIIHAAKRWTREQQEAEATGWLRELVPGWEPRLGCVLGMVNLTDCGMTVAPPGALSAQVFALAPADERDEMFGDFSEGRHAYRLADARALAEPIPWEGSQSLRNAPPLLVEYLRRRRPPLILPAAVTPAGGGKAKGAKRARRPRAAAPAGAGS